MERANEYFQFEIIANALVSSILSILNLRFTVIIILSVSARGLSLYTSESDVYRREILTYKEGPRAKKVNT